MSLSFFFFFFFSVAQGRRLHLMASVALDCFMAWRSCLKHILLIDTLPAEENSPPMPGLPTYTLNATWENMVREDKWRTASPLYRSILFTVQLAEGRVPFEIIHTSNRPVQSSTSYYQLQNKPSTNISVSSSHAIMGVCDWNHQISSQSFNLAALRSCLFH